tara:strand:+ start:215 stop:613 length:399 start_codon:yes stop_codon:yes gene_type:complete
MLSFICLVFAWSMNALEKSYAKTIVRLWHELHVEKGLVHDFSSMLAPNQDATYIGVAMHDDVRAIAECRTLDAITRVSSIAHAPNNPDAARILLEMINETVGHVDYTPLQNQPRWLLEATFVSSVFITAAEE